MNNYNYRKTKTMTLNQGTDKPLGVIMSKLSDSVRFIPTQYVSKHVTFNADEDLQARGYYGQIIKYCSKCKEFQEFYNEELWKQLNGFDSLYEFDWEYLDYEEGGWYLHVCKNSNVVAYLKSIMIKSIAS